MAHVPTMREMTLASRISNSDWVAVEELWPFVCTGPYDPNRPAMDVVNDLVEGIKTSWIFPEEDEPAKSSKPISSAEALEAMTRATEKVLDLVIESRAKAKKL